MCVDKVVALQPQVATQYALLLQDVFLGLVNHGLGLQLLSVQGLAYVGVKVPGLEQTQCHEPRVVESLVRAIQRPQLL